MRWMKRKSETEKEKEKQRRAAGYLAEQVLGAVEAVRGERTEQKTRAYSSWKSNRNVLWIIQQREVARKKGLRYWYPVRGENGA
jgi:primosomal protein N''